MSAARSATKIDLDELDSVARLVSVLCRDEIGRYPGVQLSLCGDRRRWTVVNGTGTFTYLGDRGADGLEQPVWLPRRAIYWAAELARLGDAAEVRFTHEPDGPLVSVAGVAGSGLFELPASPTVEPVQPSRRQAPELATVRIPAADLAFVISAARRGPRLGYPDDSAPVTLLPEHSGLGVGVDWSSEGAQCATYRYTAEVDGEIERCRPVTVPAVPLLALANLCEDDAELTLSFRSDGVVFVEHGRLRVSVVPVDGPLVAAPTLADVLRHVDHENYGDRLQLEVDGVKVRIVDDERLDHVRVSIVLAKGIEPTVDLFREVNELNESITSGRVVLTGQTLYAVDEVSRIELGRLTEVIGRLVATVAPLGPLVALLGVTGDGPDGTDTPDEELTEE